MALKPLIAGMSQDSTGAAGYTVPTGGLDGEILAKASNADGDFAWVAPGITYYQDWSDVIDYPAGALVQQTGVLYIANVDIPANNSPEVDQRWYVLAPPNVSFYTPGLIVDEAVLGERTASKSYRIYGFDLSVLVAPVGANIIVDLLINGVAQNKNANLLDGATSSHIIFGTEKFVQFGQTVGAKVKQVGSTFAGQYLTVDCIT